MFAGFERLRRSLRFRVVFTAGVALAVMLLLLVTNSLRLTDAALSAREQQRLAELEGLLDAALSAPLQQRDHAGVLRVLRQLRHEQGLDYLILVDQDQRIVAAEGWQAGGSPERFNGHARIGQASVEAVLPIRTGQREQGKLYFGLGNDLARQAYSDLLWQNGVIAFAALLVTVTLLWLGASRLSRDLRNIGRSVVALETGSAPIEFALPSNEETATLAAAFRRMAQTLDERVEALKKSESRFHAIADYTYGVEAWFNPQGRLIWINRSVERVTGYTPLECLLSSDLVEMLLFEKDRKHAREVAARALQGGCGENLEARLRRKDGSVIWISVNWQPIQGRQGEYLGMRVSADDIQTRKEAELKLLDTVVQLRRAQALKEHYLNHSNEERSRLEALLNVMKVGVVFVDSNHRIVYCNRPFREMWGFGPNETLTGTRDSVVVERSAALRSDDAAYRRHLEEVLSKGGSSAHFEISLRDGRVIAETSALIAGTQEGRHIGRVWIHEDITEQKRTAEKLIQLAERDPLTNLFNRRRFHEELERVIADASRRCARAGLLAMDLDGFKPINDALGHQSGDVVLVTLARNVGAVIRRNEMFFRIGGDEFAILVPDTDEEQMVGLARRVSATIAGLRFDFPQPEVSLTATLGIAIYPLHGMTGEEIIARADHAMYQAKLAGRNRWALYGGPAKPH